MEVFLLLLSSPTSCFEHLWWVASGPVASVIRTPDGGLWFRLVQSSAGLCVQRERWHADSRTRLQHCAIFGDWPTFDRWLNSDSSRFDYPLVHANVRRQGGLLFEVDQVV